MTERKFYKTILHVEILSEHPIPEDMTMADIYAETIDGRYSGRPLPSEEFVLNGKEMAAALREQSSDPGFFNLDDDGVYEYDKPTLICRICDEGLPPNTNLREHLEAHNPNARGMSDVEVQEQFKDTGE